MISGTLNISTQILAWEDQLATSNPSRRLVDWKSSVLGQQVSNPLTTTFVIPASQTVQLFNGTRTIAADNTTVWDLTTSPLGGGRHRFTNSAGLAPNLRTDRGLTLNGANITVTVVGQVATFTTDLGNFSSLLVNDVVFVPGITTGDTTSPFSTNNEGYWVVLAVSGTSVQLTRPSGTDFDAAAETVALTSDSQLQGFSPDGVQVGDGVDVSAGFATSVQKTYTVAAVNPLWFEIIDGSPIPDQSGIIPGTNGIVFYSAAKRMVWLESDQECVVRANGDTGNTVRLSPWVAADSTQRGVCYKTGPTWALSVVNRTSASMNVVMISAE